MISINLHFPSQLPWQRNFSVVIKTPKGATPKFSLPVSIFYILEQDSDVLMSGKSWRNSKKKKTKWKKRSKLGK